MAEIHVCCVGIHPSRCLVYRKSSFSFYVITMVDIHQRSFVWFDWWQFRPNSICVPVTYLWMQLCIYVVIIYLIIVIRRNGAEKVRVQTSTYISNTFLISTVPRQRKLTKLRLTAINTMWRTLGNKDAGNRLGLRYADASYL